MLLAIDIGNTNITLGLYQGDQLGPRWRLATDHERMPDEFGVQFVGFMSHAGIQPQEITGICLASVVPPLTGKIVEACRRYLGPDPLVVEPASRPACASATRIRAPSGPTASWMRPR